MVELVNRIMIRKLDDEIARKLKQLAWHEGRSPEDVARRLLIEAVNSRAARRSIARF